MSSHLDLVQTPEAGNFMQQIRIPTGRKVLLGDKTKFQGTVFNAIGFAHTAVAEGADKIGALAQDPTRNEFEKHDAARQVAHKVEGVLTQSKASIQGVTKALVTEFGAIIDDRFKLASERQAIHSDIARWIKEQAGKPDGVAIIRGEAKSHSEVVAVLHHYPRFLLGLADTPRQNIIEDGLKWFAPEAHAMIEQSGELEKLAANYERAIKDVRRSFYNPSLVDQASRRVEV